MNIEEKTIFGLFGLWFLIALVGFAGWVNNLIWLFHQVDTTSLILGIVGAVLAPVGAVHGIWLWF